MNPAIAKLPPGAKLPESPRCLPETLTSSPTTPNNPTPKTKATFVAGRAKPLVHIPSRLPVWLALRSISVPKNSYFAPPIHPF